MAVGTLYDRVSIAVTAVIIAILLGPARTAAGDSTAAGGAGECRISLVVDGDTLACDDGRTLRLAGLRAPKPAAWTEQAAFAEESRDGLSALVLGRWVTWPGSVSDRYGRLRVRMWRDDGIGVQGEMLRRGLAMVETQRESREDVAGMLALESAARAARRGLWAITLYQVQPADSVRSGGWRIVEGQVIQVAKRYGVVYLNFGADWRSDFTIRLGGDVLRDCAGAHLDPLSLQGHRLRVRGWVEWRNGPEMESDHLEQLEFLD